LNAADEDAVKWIKIFTLLDKLTIEELIAEHSAAPESRILQKKLAECITSFVHGKEEFEAAQKTTEQLFGKGEEIDLSTLSEQELLNAMEGVPVHTLTSAQLTAGMDIVSFLAETGIFPSKGEARKMVQGGGISINKEKQSEQSYVLGAQNIVGGKYIVVQKGKKNHYLVKLT